jgi:hypothetical protein
VLRRRVAAPRLAVALRCERAAAVVLRRRVAAPRLLAVPFRDRDAGVWLLVAIFESAS